MSDFIIKALQDSEFIDLFAMNDRELETLGATRMIVNANPGFPCRVSLQDAAIGEEVILISYTHHKIKGPYQSSGPIFVRKGVKTVVLNVNEIPVMFNHRLLSLRGYDKKGMMIHAFVTEGNDLKDQITTFFKNSNINYIHIHNAQPGCYNCTVMRV